MSIEMYQRSVNALDKEIADLEKKKAEEDSKAATETKKASSVNIPKNASASTLNSKLREMKRHREAAQNAMARSADYSRKIADKRDKRNKAYLRLQQEEATIQKKTAREIGGLQASYESRVKELEVQLLPRGIARNAKTFEEQPEYDVFISHASEDKASFVDELVQELKNLGIKVWYDSTHMKWGDSTRAKIDQGLKKSKFGIVVLSPDYIKEGKYWTKTELNALFQLESVNGKTILPIWHNLTKREVMEYSPIIADRNAMNTASFTPKEIAEEMLKLLNVGSADDAESVEI